MGKYALIVVATLVLLTSYFVIANNRLRHDSTVEAIYFNELNNSKNVSNSALQVGIKNLVSMEWNVPDGETWYLNTNNSWAQKTSYADSPFHQWSEINGYYSLSAERQADLITLTSVGKTRFDSEVKHETKAVLEIIEAFFDNPDFDYSIFSMDDIILGGTATINGNIGTNGTVSMSNNVTVTGDIDENLNLNYQLPDFPDFPDNLTFYGDLDILNNQTYTIDSDGEYGNIRVRNGGVLTIHVGTGERNVRVSSLTVLDKIVLTGSGKLNLYIDEEFSLSGEVNKDGHYSQFICYFSGVDDFKLHGGSTLNGSVFLETADFDSHTSVINGHVVSGGGNVKINGDKINGLLYAPNANFDMRGNIEIRGAIVSKKFEAGGTAQIIHEDIDDLNGIDYGLIKDLVIHRFSY